MSFQNPTGWKYTVKVSMSLLSLEVPAMLEDSTFSCVFLSGSFPPQVCLCPRFLFSLRLYESSIWALCLTSLCFSAHSSCLLMLRAWLSLVVKQLLDFKNHRCKDYSVRDRKMLTSFWEIYHLSARFVWELAIWGHIHSVKGGTEPLLANEQTWPKPQSDE